MSLPSVSVAECATCGTVASEFGRVWGAAKYFKGSIVTYDNMMKIKYLGVEENLATNFIEHPEQVVIQMAKGVVEMFDTQIGLSTSGYATPYPPKGVTTPYIWFAIYDRKQEAIVESGRIDNTEYLSRGAFQKKVGMTLHLKYMIHFGTFEGDA